MKSLQNKIFLLFVILLLMVQAIAFWTLYSEKKNQEAAEINNRLTTAKTIFTELFDRRLTYLSTFAETVAKDYGLKEVFNEDTRSLLFALNNHRKRIDADLAMTISSAGIINGQLQRHFVNGKGKIRQGAERNSAFRFSEWLETGQAAHLYMIDDALYQLSLSPVTVGAKTLGWIAFGFEIDERLADEFKNITGLNTDFIIKNEGAWQLISVVQSSENNESYDKLLELAVQVIENKAPDQYIATHSLITEFDDQEFGVAMHGLRANFVALLQEQWWKFLFLAALTLLLSLTSAYFIAGSISKPIKRLVAQAKVIASGDYQQKVTLKDNNEIGQLADEFNQMQAAVLQREEAITHRADHDPLTDLPNRNKLNKTLKKLIEQQKNFLVLHLNLSRLKDVNDTLGHDVGDEVIKELASRLHNLCQMNSFNALAHLGADEFILLVEHLKVDEAIYQLRAELEPIFDYQGISLQLQVRIGVAAYPEHAVDDKSLLQMADTALNSTREKRKLVQIYHPDLDVNTVERLSLINDLKQAIPAGELELHFQPKMCLKTKTVTHAEALVRWQHPTLGMVPPDNFIHIAEQTGQIKALTRWVFITALDQYNAWQEQGIDLNIAINVSAENLKENDFHHFICQSIMAAKVPAEKITLEVTESSVVEDPEAAIKLLAEFKDYGMKISIDDYGTGYSSLAQLKQLPVHELKIDKSFIQHLEHDEDDQIIVRSTIELAHNMGLHVVAEGIEDEFALNWLAAHGCELAQGYYISKPKPAMELTPWLLAQLTIQDVEEKV
ncbi:bifunctional diguanylate cyclase/phosphodiesterase [Colwellia psychrerythraea]|uniref:cyclic-guanylate-specific phosphodiesterase n=1 Tax=Colwellia psychrerythraea (strain 34H / ATCC BAA-681) TaxID=167879 RepID=Q487V3_COLP3|nr:EAL domain-containing protein [Colwellia psychrerythraea]AAZ28548.1 sensory box sensor/GGDEF/EAL domain protein [Colwellia psychrerythraea 34H]